MEKEAIVKYRRFLKRRNYSAHTIKTYMNTLEHFLRWLSLPVEEVTSQQVSAYIDFLLAQGLAPKTINCRLDSVRGFFTYWSQEEGIPRPNPVKKGFVLRLARPLPRYLKDEEVTKLFQTIQDLRDRAIFMLMLRCGLRVEEVGAPASSGSRPIPKTDPRLPGQGEQGSGGLYQPRCRSHYSGPT